MAEAKPAPKLFDQHRKLLAEFEARATRAEADLSAIGSATFSAARAERLSARLKALESAKEAEIARLDADIAATKAELKQVQVQAKAESKLLAPLAQGGKEEIARATTTKAKKASTRAK